MAHTTHGSRKGGKQESFKQWWRQQEFKLFMLFLKRFRAGIPILSYPEQLADTGYSKAIYEISKSCGKQKADDLDAYLSVVVHILPQGYELNLDLHKNSQGFTLIRYSSEVTK